MHSPDALQELLPPLSPFAALDEANRCLFCYDAPCTHACPTHIDIPRFIKKIATGNLTGSARAIFEANLLGATCARVCPVQELCEGACVLGPTHKPIAIGRLQRYSMDHAYANSIAPFVSAPATGRSFAVIGAGPAGLSCAGELARLGNHVTVFDKRTMPGGLSTYGIIGLREPINVALAEAGMMERMGVKIRLGAELGRNLSLEDLKNEFEAVVLSAGLGSVPQLGIEGEERVLDGLEYIEMSKTTPSALKPGTHVIVIGAGNTAIDCATIAKRLGAARVTIVYRRTEDEMTAYPHEYTFAKAEGIEFRFLTQPIRALDQGLECVRTHLGELDGSGRPRALEVAGSEFLIEADQVVKAIGQNKPSLAALLGLQIVNGYIAVDSRFQTSVPGVFAIGDCVRSSGSASTVMAVQDGKLAAVALHG